MQDQPSRGAVLTATPHLHKQIAWVVDNDPGEPSVADRNATDGGRSVTVAWPSHWLGVSDA